MASNFNPPPFFQPQDYSFIPKSIDQIFDAYAKAKAARELEQRQGIANQMQFGFDPMQDPQALAAFMERKRQMDALQMQKAQAEVEPKRQSLDDMLAQKVQGGEISMEDAYRMRMPGTYQQPRPEYPIPPGYAPTPEGGLRAIPGGPAEQKNVDAAERAKKASESERAHAFDVTDAADNAIKRIGFWTSGITGAAMGKVPGTKRQALQGYIDTLKSNLAFGRLQEMRASNKTGAGLGAVSDAEMKLLSSTVSALDADQPSDVLIQNIKKVRDLYAEISSRGTGAPGKPIGLTGDKAKRLAELRKRMGGR